MGIGLPSEFYHFRGAAKMARAKPKPEQKCKTCYWWDAPNGVCCNSGSEQVADFTHEDFSCECWGQGHKKD